MARLRNIIIALALICLAIPFVLTIDVYPFYRFGMYSKSLKSLKSVNKYSIMLNYADSSVAYPETYSQDLLSRYVYRGESHKLLKNIRDKASGDTLLQSIELRSIEYSKGGDTVLGYKLIERLNVKK